MELTYGFLKTATTAMNKLGKAPLYGSTLSNLIKLRRKLSEIYPIANKKGMAVVMEHTKKNEKGEPVLDENGNSQIDPEKFEAFQKAEQEWADTKFELKGCNKIHIDTFINFPNLGLSASDIETLAPILDGLDETQI